MKVADWSVFNGVNPNKEFELALACVEQSARALLLFVCFFTTFKENQNILFVQRGTFLVLLGLNSCINPSFGAGSTMEILVIRAAKP